MHPSVDSTKMCADLVLNDIMFEIWYLRIRVVEIIENFW